ncbi:MAG: hypothetical protein M1840_002383 [Geoglossum simile]|nr:MAG: hypothetical protein M1840_002383 [Geoglossum simile]
MCPEPLSALVIVAQMLRIAYKLRSVEGEMHAYQNSLEATSDLISHVDSTRTKLAARCTAEARARIDNELRRARTALENAKTAMGWRDETRAGVLGTVDAVEWALKYKEAAKAHNALLRLCHDTLIGICIELAMLSGPRPSETYFKEKQASMLAALSRRVMKNEVIYSGVGEQAPRPRLFESEQQRM